MAFSSVFSIRTVPPFLSLLAILGAASCRERITLAEGTELRIEAAPLPGTVGFGTAGQPYRVPLRFQVTGDEGAAVAGVAVDFTVVGGSSTLSRPTAVTDSAGYVEVNWVFGSDTGWEGVEARVRGSLAKAAFSVVVEPPVTLRLLQDSLSLREGASGVLDARIYRIDGTEVKAVSVDFRSSDTAVARVQAVDGVGGTYAHQVRYVVARKAGTTQVVASYEGGVDTAQVRVLAPESSAPR